MRKGGHFYKCLAGQAGNLGVVHSSYTMTQIQVDDASDFVFCTAIESSASFSCEGETDDLRAEWHALAQALESLRAAPSYDSLPDEILNAIKQAGQMCQHYLDYKRDFGVEDQHSYFRSLAHHYGLMAEILRALTEKFATLST